MSGGLALVAIGDKWKDEVSHHVEVFLEIPRPY